MANFLNDPEYIAAQMKTFALFMARDGYADRLMVAEEFLRLRANVDVLKGTYVAYLRMQRTGSRFALDRHKRERIAQCFIKASEHAGFAYTRSLEA